MTSSYDIAIVGGGLAGLSLAIQAADAGYATVVFEKETYPFHKVCGEYISMESYGFLQRLGVPLDSLQLPRINKLHLSDVEGRPYAFDLPLGGFGISRYLLDNTLYEIVKSKGVTFRLGTKVQDVRYELDQFTIVAGDAEYKSRVIAGCYGKRSNLDIKWKRPFTLQRTGGENYVGVKYHILNDHPDDVISLHNFKNGYCGMSSIEEGKSCLCYLTTAQELKKAGGSIPQLEKDLLYRNPELKRIFSSAEFIYAQPLAISQISFAKKSAVENHVLMLGDAAGLITPLCGNGMSMALHASAMSYPIISRFLSGGITRHQMEEQYQRDWSKLFSKRLLVGRTVQQMFGAPVTTRLFLQTMKLFPVLARVVIKSTHGRPF